VKAQVLNVARIPFVQRVLKDHSQPLAIHGLVYSLHDGVLNNMHCSIDTIEDVPEQYRVI
jgi:carbonic anhydrase